MQTIEINGKAYAVRIEQDDSGIIPWKEYDIHGPVSDWTNRAKRPGERILAEDRRSRLYYDFQAAVRLAHTKWGNPKGEASRDAAEADFQNLRSFCNDGWHYVGVIVSPICPCCNQPVSNASASVWAIESNSDPDYFDEVARDLAAECGELDCCESADA